MSWGKVKLGEVLFYEQPTKYIVASDNYNDEFKIPVLTAGKSFILGYTNETEGIFENLPVIIFDDFTADSKYVDFRFKVKSSAMKILQVNKEKADLRFLFYLMQTLNVDCEQHKRYWISKFAELEIPLPPLPIQKHIAEILDAADALRRKDQELLRKYDELAQAIFIDMFGDPVKNEKGWEVKELDDVCSKITDGEHGTVERFENGKLYLMARNIRDNVFDLNDVDYVSQSQYELINKRCNPEVGDILLVCVGATIGRAAIVPEMEPFCLARSVALLKLDQQKILPFFLYSFIKSDFMQSKIQRAGNSSAQAGLYTGKIKCLPIYLPPLSLQIKYESLMKVLLEKKLKLNLSFTYSQNLFASLLQQAFKGELVK